MIAHIRGGHLHRMEFGDQTTGFRLDAITLDPKDIGKIAFALASDHVNGTQRVLSEFQKLTTRMMVPWIARKEFIKPRASMRDGMWIISGSSEDTRWEAAVRWADAENKKTEQAREALERYGHDCMN